MKQIIKVESIVDDKYCFDSNVRELLKGRTDLIVQDVTMDDGDMCFIVKQISYQYFDFENEKWVVLPNPTQPKIEGVNSDE